MKTFNHRKLLPVTGEDVGRGKTSHANSLAELYYENGYLARKNRQDNIYPCQKSNVIAYRIGKKSSKNSYRNTKD